MITPPTAPSPGKPVSASFFARLIAWVKSGQFVEGKGYRLHRTPNGTSLELLAGTAKGSSQPSPDIGRFAIASIAADEPPESGGGGVSPAQSEEEEEEQTYTVTFKNPYYDIGGKTYEMPVDEEFDPPAVGISDVKDGDLIVLKIKAGQSRSEELVTVGSIAELQQLQEDVANYSIPLYKIQGGAAVCDFRTGPICAMGEF